MTRFLWLLSALLGAAWLLCAGFNAAAFWRRFVRKDERAPSMIPLAGWFAAFIAVQAVPIHDPLQKLLLLASAAVLDAGTGFFLLFALRAYLAARIGGR